MKERNFVRLDSNNKFVVGSNVRGKRPPENGRWYEIFTPNCCEVTVPAGDPDGPFTIITVYSNGEVIAELDANSNNLVTVASIFNQNYPGLGEWSGTADSLSLVSPLPNITLSLRYGSAPSQGTTTTSTSTTSTSTSTTSSTSSSTTSSTSTSSTTSTTTTTLP